MSDIQKTLRTYVCMGLICAAVVLPLRAQADPVVGGAASAQVVLTQVNQPISRISNERVIKAQEKYKAMARNAERRCLVGYFASIAWRGVELYSMLNFDPQPAEIMRAYKQATWTQMIKQCCVNFAEMAVKSLVLSVIHEKAQPLLAQFSEKIWVPTKGHWLFEDAAQYIHVPHDVFALMTLLQVFEKSVDNLAQCSMEYENERKQAVELMKYIVASSEKILGYLNYSAGTVALDDVVESMMIERMGNRFHNLVDHFCHAIEQMLEVSTVDKTPPAWSALCRRFGHECRVEFSLLRALSSYQFEMA